MIYVTNGRISLTPDPYGLIEFFGWSEQEDVFQSLSVQVHIAKHL